MKQEKGEDVQSISTAIVGVWLIAAVLCMAWGPFVEAQEPLQPEEKLPATEVSGLPPSAEDVTRIVKELASVRDYERLHWILTAVERQVPPVRAELLKTLDDQVQQLMKAEVELRTATALASIQPLLNAQPKAPEAQAGDSMRASTARHRSGEEKAPSARPPWVTPKAYGEMKQTIEQAHFVADPVERLRQTQQFMNEIFGVEDSQQRQELRALVLKRSEEARQQQVEALRQSIIADLTRPVSAPTVAPESN